MGKNGSRQLIEKSQTTTVRKERYKRTIEADLGESTSFVKGMLGEKGKICEKERAKK